jgi:hypothetical protein
MTDTFAGTVTGVYELGLGDKLSAAAAVNDTVLHVYSVVDFDEDGGWLRLNDAILEYVTRDSDDLTITLAAPLAVAAALDDVVDAWDLANGQPFAVTKAVLDDVDGFSGNPVEAYVSQSIAHILSTTMREGKGETVILSRDQGALEVVGVEGRQFALAALQYLQGGMTTRQSDGEPGVDILGVDSGTVGVYVIGTNGTMIVLRDDGSEGIIEFHTGQAGEIAGQINPGVTGSRHYIDFVTTTPTGIAQAPGTMRLLSTSSTSDGKLSLTGATALEVLGNVATFFQGVDIPSGALNADNDVNVGGAATFNKNSGTIVSIPHLDANSGGTANVNWNSANGNLRLISSSRRFKSEISDADVDTEAVLQLVPRIYLHQNDGDPVWEIGFIAEEAEDLGLEQWVTRDRDGEVFGFDYMRWVVALQAVAREDREQIKTLRDENTALRDRVERLEEAVAKLTRET